MPLYFEGNAERRLLPFSDFATATDHHTLVVEAAGTKFVTTTRTDDGPSQTWFLEGGGQFTVRQSAEKLLVGRVPVKKYEHRSV